MSLRAAAPTDPRRDTHAFRDIAGQAVPADVIGAVPGARKPAVVWMHGGGLIFGSRCWSPRAALLRALLERDFVVVSIDYRLAPETKLPEIFSDVQAAWQWVQHEGPARFGIDRTRVALAGASAGGYLALLGGLRLAPRPRALVSFWGYGDILASWETEPSAHYRQQTLMTREQALDALAAPPLRDPAEGIDRSIFYLYCRQQGCWVEEVTGQRPTARAELEPWCPLLHIDASFPPTLLVHGTDDTDVPHDASVQLAARLAVAGVDHEFRSLPAVGHGFAGAAPQVAEDAERAAADFLQARLRQRTAA